MLYRHVFDKISTEFRRIFRVFVNVGDFTDLPEFRSSATVQNIKSLNRALQIPKTSP